MERDVMIDRLMSLRLPYDKEVLYDILKELGIKHKRTNCRKCLVDYLNIAKEEVGLIKDASQESAFDGERRYRYLKSAQTMWNGEIYDNNTDDAKIERFSSLFDGFYADNGKDLK